MLTSAGTIVLYTTVGGFLAVSLVDFFQGILMFSALIVLPVTALFNMGGVSEIFQTISIVDASYLDMLDNIKFVGMVSLFAWGLGYFGQPHINVRFMAIRSINELPIARRICMIWMITSLIGAILTGIVGFVYFLTNPLVQKETVFIALSQGLFGPWIAGILLSAVLSAIISTVAAQILMIASIFAEDFYHTLLRKHASNSEYLWVSRACIVLVSAFVILLASNFETTILHAVAFAWSGLGASFGPVILFSLYWRRMTREGAIAGVLIGAMSVIFLELLGIFSTKAIFSHQDYLPGFNILPGFILGSIIIVLVSLKTNVPEKTILDEFDETLHRIKELESSYYIKKRDLI